jgi:hypothetical protein
MTTRDDREQDGRNAEAAAPMKGPKRRFCCLDLFYFSFLFTITNSLFLDSLNDIAAPSTAGTGREEEETREAGQRTTGARDASP